MTPAKALKCELWVRCACRQEIRECLNCTKFDADLVSAGTAERGATALFRILKI